MNIVFFALWFFLPAGISNMMPIFAAKIPLLSKFSYPLDLGKSFGGKRIFGDHKTIRGLVFGVLSGIIIAWIQMVLYKNIIWIHSFVTFDYMKGNPFIFGFLLSFGALAGDSIKSFFKRRSNVGPGGTWFPFDQIDYIVGGILFSLLWVRLSWNTYFSILVVWFLLHIISTIIGYLLKLKDSPL